METHVSNPNDHKVVTFTNKEDFEFTPDLGCMYDSRPIFGKSGASVEAGESVVLPYHIGNLIARNLAKYAMVQAAPVDKKNIPTGETMWNEESLKSRQASYIEDMYREEKPTTMTETDRLMAKVEEYKALVEKVVPPSEMESVGNDPEEETTGGDKNTPQSPENGNPVVYQDKADVIEELKKRNIQFDARKSKTDLEKLLVN